MPAEAGIVAEYQRGGFAPEHLETTSVREAEAREAERRAADSEPGEKPKTTRKQSS